MSLHTPMPWLVAAVDQLFARANEIPGLSSLTETIRPDVIFMPLREPENTEGWGVVDWARWEFTCDNCLKVAEDIRTFHSGSYIRLWKGWKVIVGYGCCDDCFAGAEEVTP